MNNPVLKIFLILLLAYITPWNALATDRSPDTYKIINLILTWDSDTDYDLFINKNSLSFFVIGDWGMGNTTQKQVAEAMDNYAAQSKIDFIVTTGDNFYPEGVLNATDPLWKTYFEDIYQTSNLEGIPWYIVLGNHDYAGDINAQIEYGKNHSSWILPSRFHDITISLKNHITIQMLFLDTNLAIKTMVNRPDLYQHIDEVTWNQELDWLRNKLSNSGSNWRLVFGHHPVYSSGTVHGNTEDLFPDLPSIFETYRINAYFSGHEHELEHYKPAGFTHYYISGGGANFRSVQQKPDSLFTAESAGFAYVKIENTCMLLKFIDNHGYQLYETRQSLNHNTVCP